MGKSLTCHGLLLQCRWKLNGKPAFSFQDLQQNKRQELERLSEVYRSNLEKAEVKFIEGRGKLLDKNTVEVNGSQYKVSSIPMHQHAIQHIISIPLAFRHEWVRVQ